MVGLFGISSMQPQTNSSRAQWQWDRHTQTDSGNHLVVVSNRQPYRHSRSESGIDVDRPTGGLTEGLDPAMQDIGGTWVAWGDGDADAAVVDSNDRVSVPPTDESYVLKRVWLSEDDVDRYYYGLSNRVLWPLCHSFPGKIEYRAADWDRYRRINQRFASATVAEATDTTPIWFQDYHLALAPAMVRSMVETQATLQHFWHIPWPAWDVYRIVPNSRSLLRGLLGNDRLGFHVQRYCQNFLTCVDAAIPEAQIEWDRQQIHYRGRLISVDAIPMGVPVDDIQSTVRSSDTRGLVDRFRDDYGIQESTRLAIGVDRLDYTKGIVERLDALAHFFETHPGWRGELTYVQNASESRSQIPAYSEIQSDVRDAVAEINDQYGTDEWQPVVLTTDRLARDTLLALYRHADVGIVSPLRDGLNLVAQEYIAAQTDRDGVLLLSQNAGIHDLIGHHALSIDPYETPTFSTAIETALGMSREERRRRMSNLQQIISRHDLQQWVETQLDAIHPAGIAPEE
ncbi:MAG: trehalose-6-phosphate synthase [Halorientalis sp.]